MRLDIFVTFCLTKRPSEREFWHFCPNSFFVTYFLFFKFSVIGSVLKIQSCLFMKAFLMLLDQLFPRNRTENDLDICNRRGAACTRLFGGLTVDAD